MNKFKKIALTAGVTIGLVAGGATAAQAQPHDWSGVAACESGGNWNINTGNGYYGGLQFSQSSWAAAGGTQYAPRADLATRAQQEETAYNLMQMQGIGAWPTCGGNLGYGGGGSQPEPVAQPVAPAPQPVVSEPVAEKPVKIIPETVEVPEVEVPENNFISQEQVDNVRQDIVNTYDAVVLELNTALDHHLY